MPRHRSRPKSTNSDKITGPYRRTATHGAATAANPDMPRSDVGVRRRSDQKSVAARVIIASRCALRAGSWGLGGSKAHVPEDARQHEQLHAEERLCGNTDHLGRDDANRQFPCIINCEIDSRYCIIQRKRWKLNARGCSGQPRLFMCSSTRRTSSFPSVCRAAYRAGTRCRPPSPSG